MGLSSRKITGPGSVREEGGGGEYTNVVVSGGKLGIEITGIMSSPHLIEGTELW